MRATQLLQHAVFTIAGLHAIGGLCFGGMPGTPGEGRIRIQVALPTATTRPIAGGLADDGRDMAFRLRWMYARILTQDVSFDERLKGTADLAMYVMRSAGLDEGRVAAACREERRLIEQLIRLQKEGQPIPAVGPLAELNAVYSPEGLSIREYILRCEAPKIAMLSGTAEPLWLLLSAAERVRGGPLTVTEQEIKAERERRETLHLLDLDDRDLITSIRLDRAEDILNEYVLSALNAGEIHVPDMLREALVRELKR